MAENADLREPFRAAAIQAFVFTHEMAYKLLKRQLEQIVADPISLDRMSWMDVVRSGAEAGLIPDVARFRTYLENRDIASHAYDQAKAERIEAVLPDFRDDVRFLLDELERRNRNDD